MAFVPAVVVQEQKHDLNSRRCPGLNLANSDHLSLVELCCHHSTHLIFLVPVDPNHLGVDLHP